MKALSLSKCFARSLPMPNMLETMLFREKGRAIYSMVYLKTLNIYIYIYIQIFVLLVLTIAKIL